MNTFQGSNYSMELLCGAVELCLVDLPRFIALSGKLCLDMLARIINFEPYW